MDDATSSIGADVESEEPAAKLADSGLDDELDELRTDNSELDEPRIDDSALEALEVEEFELAELGTDDLERGEASSSSMSCMASGNIVGELDTGGTFDVASSASTLDKTRPEELVVESGGDSKGGTTADEGIEGADADDNGSVGTDCEVLDVGFGIESADGSAERAGGESSEEL